MSDEVEEKLQKMILEGLAKGMERNELLKNIAQILVKSSLTDKQKQVYRSSTKYIPILINWAETSGRESGKFILGISSSKGSAVDDATALSYVNLRGYGFDTRYHTVDITSLNEVKKTLPQCKKRLEKLDRESIDMCLIGDIAEENDVKRILRIVYKRGRKYGIREGSTIYLCPESRNKPFVYTLSDGEFKRFTLDGYRKHLESLKSKRDYRVGAP